MGSLVYSLSMLPRQVHSCFTPQWLSCRHFHCSDYSGACARRCSRGEREALKKYSTGNTTADTKKTKKHSFPDGFILCASTSSFPSPPRPDLRLRSLISEGPISRPDGVRPGHHGLRVLRQRGGVRGSAERDAPAGHDAHAGGLPRLAARLRGTQEV